MRNQLILFCGLMLLFVFSCQDDFSESLVPNEFTSVSNELIQAKPKLIFSTFQQLNGIHVPLLSDKLSNVKEYIPEIIVSEQNCNFSEHKLYDLWIDTSNVFVQSTSSDVSCTFLVIIPHIKNDESLNQYAYLTLNFNSGQNTENRLLFGSQMDCILTFDSTGNIQDNFTAIFKKGPYTPKPSNLPSKAPKDVICRYFSNTMGGGNLTLASFCSSYFYPSTSPAPQFVLDALFSGNLTHNYNDLYILNLSSSTTSPFSSFYPYPFISLRDEFINFYSKVFIPHLGYSVPVSSNITQAMHINKQAFIESFQSWMFELTNNAPSTFNYLSNNPTVLYKIFNFFANYNLAYDESEGVYIGVQWGEYSPNQDIRCLKIGGDYLLTPSGFTLIQQLGSGTISIEQFGDALPSCS